MTVGIYAIFSTVDGECLYVGQSSFIEKRFRQHVTKLKNRRSNAFVDWCHLNGASEDTLELRILQITPNEDLLKNKFEDEWFKKLTPRFYGKRPSLRESWSHSIETRSKISQSMAKFSLQDFLNSKENHIRNFVQTPLLH